MRDGIRLDLGASEGGGPARVLTTPIAAGRRRADWCDTCAIAARVAGFEREVLGILDDYATRSGFLITPVVVWAGPVGTLTKQAAEVARIHVIPLP